MICDMTFRSIAGFCRYYGQPVISRDRAFDRVRGLRGSPTNAWSRPLTCLLHTSLTQWRSGCGDAKSSVGAACIRVQSATAGGLREPKSPSMPLLRSLAGHSGLSLLVKKRKSRGWVVSQCRGGDGEHASLRLD
jgi:hypothetical protein